VALVSINVSPKGKYRLISDQRLTERYYLRVMLQNCEKNVALSIDDQVVCE
jgi:hypothetical protein